MHHVSFAISQRLISLESGKVKFYHKLDDVYIMTSGYIALRIRLYVLRKGLPLHPYSKDGIGTLNPILGRGLDS